jgi:ASTRA-associated protein 1
MADYANSHGRDDCVRVWHVPTTAEDDLSKVLPTESSHSHVHRKDPWLLHSLPVKTISFCALSVCQDAVEPSASLLMAVPSPKLGEVDIFKLPDESRLHVIPPSPMISAKPAMIMALRLFRFATGVLALLSANEGGAAILQTLSPENGVWTTIYSSSSHNQPIIGLDLAPTLGHFYTSAADSIIARYPLPRCDGDIPSDHDRVVIKTGHAGQQGLVIRSDDRIFATAGWDSRVRVYSTTSMQEVAVLKWHKEACYSVAFAEILNVVGRRDNERELKGNDIHPADGLIGNYDEQQEEESTDQGGSVVNQEPKSLQSVKQRREQKTQNTHWLAAGSKDGKISLWDIF